jgi:uncharacterized cupin superfamily protein
LCPREVEAGIGERHRPAVTLDYRDVVAEIRAFGQRAGQRGEARCGLKRGHGRRSVGPALYELDPGAVGSPLHVHHANEELLLVLAGTLSLRGPDGTQLLPAGAVVAFPRGHAGAHSLVNRSDAPVRYLVVSTTNRPDVVEYPDTAATLVVLAEQRLAYPHGAAADQKPVIAEAMRAAADRDA